MENRSNILVALTLIMIGLFPLESLGIELAPTNDQIEQAVERGLKASRERVPPNELYSWFGSDQELEPKGFLMTKMNGLVVMASHFGLRGEEPSTPEIERILVEEMMLVSVTIFGSTPTFAKNSYMVLKQGEKLVKPVKVRFDAVGHRTRVWPQAPRYKGKVIGSFRYDGFDPKVRTSIIVFPSEGGEEVFEVDFSKVH